MTNPSASASRQDCNKPQGSPSANNPQRSENRTSAEADGGQALLLRIQFLCAMGVAAAIFWYVGWEVARPIDPAGPVSLLMLDQGVVAMAELLALAVVSSGLAVAICGAGSAERGPLAIAVGLAALGLRGAQLDAMVLYRLNPPAANAAGLDPFPVWALIAECWLWLALIGVGFVVGRWVEGWFNHHEQRSGLGATDARGQDHRRDACATKDSTVSSPRDSLNVDPALDIRQGLGTIAVAALVAWTVMSFTIGGEVNPILKGQVYFSVSMAFLVGALAAHWVLRTASRRWALVAITVVATIAYAFGEPAQATIAAAREAGSYVNLAPLARPLPIEFAAMGTIGVLLEPGAMQAIRALFGIEIRPR